MVEQDKVFKTETGNNAKAVKQNNVIEEKIKETFDDHFKGTMVDPHLDLNAEQLLSEGEFENSNSTEVTEAIKQVDESNETISWQQEDKDNQCSEEDVDENVADQKSYNNTHINHDKALKATDSKNSTTGSNKVRYYFLILVFSLLGFLVGQYYETSSRNTVYVLDEAKFLKLASIGIATSDRDSSSTDLSEGDKLKVKDAIIQVNEILSKAYTRYPVLIQKRYKKGYEVYNLARRIDITVPVLIALIGEEKWAEIGKILK